MPAYIISMSIFAGIVGIVVVIIGLLMKNPSRFPKRDAEEWKKEEALEKAMDEADVMIQEMNRFSEHIINEIENKHRELLFLYQLIDEKHQQVREMYGQKETFKKDSRKNGDLMPQIDEKNMSPIEKNPRYQEIRKMYEQGISISQIAKQMNIGQGEVQVILELGKMR